MSMSASLRNWWYMLGSFFLITSSAFGSLRLIQEMSRKTPPCGLPRPSRISRMMQRATWSRVRSSGGLRALLAPSAARVGLGVGPAWLLVVGGLAAIVRWDGVEEEPPALLVQQHPALAADALG